MTKYKLTINGTIESDRKVTDMMEELEARLTDIPRNTRHEYRVEIKRVDNK